MPILPSKEDADITPGIIGYQCTSKFQLVPAGNSETIYYPKEEKGKSKFRINLFDQRKYKSPEGMPQAYP